MKHLSNNMSKFMIISLILIITILLFIVLERKYRVEILPKFISNYDKNDRKELAKISNIEYDPKVKFIILIYIHNSNNLNKCFRSVIEQEYPDELTAVCVIEDFSTENGEKTRHMIEKYSKENKNWGHLFNNSYEGFVKSYIKALELLNAEDDHVVLTINGGDELNNTKVLNKINDEYVKNPENKATIGNFLSMDDEIQQTGPVLNCNIDWSKNIENALIESGNNWFIIHPKTFTYGLFKKVIEKGNYQRKGKYRNGMSDLEFMIPMLINSEKKFKCIDEVLYESFTDEKWLLRNIKIR